MDANQKFPAGVAKKLLALMKEIGVIEKTGRNITQNYAFVEESVVVTHVRVAMIKVGLVLIPSLIEKSMTPIESKSGGHGFITHVTMRYQLVDTDTGECLEFLMPGDGQDYGDKGIYKAITGAHKYALLKCVQLSSGDDPERDNQEAVTSIAQPVQTTTPHAESLPFGKHKGKKLEAVPTDYLGWLLGDLKDKNARPELQAAIIHELDARALIPPTLTTKGDVNLFEYAKQLLATATNKGVAIATRAQYKADPRLSLDQQIALDDVMKEKWEPVIEANEDP